MFWKKRDINKYSLRFNKKDNRASYRYSPDEKDKLFTKIDGKEFEVLNISAGGLAFTADFCENGDKYLFELNFLYDEHTSVKGTLKIVSAKEGICRAKFIDMEPHEIEKIHKFVFNKQLKKIREKRIQFREEQLARSKK